MRKLLVGAALFLVCLLLAVPSVLGGEPENEPRMVTVQHILIGFKKSLAERSVPTVCVHSSQLPATNAEDREDLHC